MDVYRHMLRSVPLFRHCTDEEITALKEIGRFSSIKKGQTFDLRRISSFNVVIDGAFEIEALGRTDIVYLAPGSFFGNVPFTDNRLRGTIRAMVDSTLMLFSMEELYRFFLMSYRCLRGYLKIAERIGFDVNSAASRYISMSTSVIASFSMERQSGKTLFAAALARALSDKGKTVLLDLSYGGSSLFDRFDKKIRPPLSQIAEEGKAAQDLIRERLEPVSETLDLLNIAHGSKVRVKGDILQPILFVLSQQYRYVVMDLSDDDSELRDGCFALADSVFCLLANPREKGRYFPVVDAAMQNGQRVYYLLNEGRSKSVRDFAGGYLLERCERGGGTDETSFTETVAHSESMARVAGTVMEKRRAAVFASTYLDAAFYGGFLEGMKKRGLKFDIFYSSSLGYVVLALFHLSEDMDQFRKRFLELFSEDRFAGMLDVTFPSGHLFRKNGIARFAEEVAGRARLEELHSMAMVSLCDAETGKRRMLSTGQFSGVIAASMAQHPLFEGIPVSGRICHSGFPENPVRAEDLFRTDVDEVVYVSVNNVSRLRFDRGKVLPFYREYIDHVLGKNGGDITCDVASRNYVITVAEDDMRGEKFLRLAEEAANKLLK